MHRIFIDYHVVGSKVTIEDFAEMRHLAKVLRAEEGFVFEVCDAGGKVFDVEIVEMGESSVVGKVISETKAGSRNRALIDLFQAVPKKNNMDLIVQKNTELGINSVRPFTSSRTIVKIDKDNEGKKLERWRRIAKEAAKQSKRIGIPSVMEVVSFEEMITCLKEYDLVILLYEGEKRTGLNCLESGDKQFRKVAIIVGPEGGFSTDEAGRLKKSGAVSISLGPRILRTETAGFAALSILQYILGDMRGD